MGTIQRIAERLSNSDKNDGVIILTGGPNDFGDDAPDIDPHDMTREDVSKIVFNAVQRSRAENRTVVLTVRKDISVIVPSDARQMASVVLDCTKCRNPYES